MPQIYHIGFKELNNKEYFQEHIASDMKNNYYWSDDWSCEFYIALAKAGFISTTHDSIGGLVLLPELQYDYAVLYFKDLYISSKVKKLLTKNNYNFSVDNKFDEVLDKFSKYHKDNWLKDKYIETLKSLHLNKNDRDDFKITSFEVVCNETNEIIAGEVGYIIGATYTSLSGFSSREKNYSNYGTLQLVLLAQYLKNHNFEFWNLGHPHMEYKKRLGCTVLNRSDFLKVWNKAIN